MMSISSLGNYINPATYGTQQATSATTAASSAINPAATSSAATADWVTLSPDAQAVAKLNSAGITVESVRLADNPNLLNFAQLAEAVSHVSDVDRHLTSRQ
jgi:hypothetical protein